ncbi:hypothetical protein NE237_006659 [Protea cynaroides]|uniref:Uncharacterized protein n=1 Tax=Protea cynaroides TaxID=273540 RepID=A0A9Q0QVN3_9MAGN|nr:hypothetical protein NE237_006659 [Protea cynaroides]
MMVQRGGACSDDSKVGDKELKVANKQWADVVCWREVVDDMVGVGNDFDGMTSGLWGIATAVTSINGWFFSFFFLAARLVKSDEVLMGKEDGNRWPAGGDPGVFAGRL